ncbi:hypothetical protein BKA70DRAFT_1218550 [Coprinopsis sp. MPI-PUGE-AT-0042]|nr:hypothetical protein BKA70DRAFT_1218550 [Coprinopsis sp. MPI-PUGE-AT-0042]
MALPAEQMKSTEHRPLAHLKYEELRNHLLRHGRNHFITMSLDDWLNTCLLDPSGIRWSKQRAENIKERLRSEPTPVINDSGSGKAEVMVPDHDYKPDGRFTFTEATPRLSQGLERSNATTIAGQHRESDKASFLNENCAGIIEFKTKDGPADRAQRTHVYALSMEKHSTRLWCFDRTAIRASPGFDCNKFPEILIRFFLYMTFADKRQLGFDPTVQRRIVSDDELAYICQCGGAYCRTEGPPICDDNALFLTSRGVRTWKVQKCTEDRIVMDRAFRVLKDFWLDEDRPSESVIWEQAYTHKALDERERRLFRRLMTEILVDETVSVEVGGISVYAKTLGLPASYNFDDFLSLRKEPSSQGRRSFSSASVLLPPAAPTRYKVKLAPRFHRRDEMCDPSARHSPTGKLPDFFQVVGELSVALLLFKKAGFMHRDISSGGNCMAYWDPDQQTWMGKLHDCEHGKGYSSTSSSDSFKRHKERARPLVTLVDPLASLKDVSLATYLPKNSGRGKPPNDNQDAEREPFHYRPYYDLEALFWVVVWVVLHSLMVTTQDATLQGTALEDWRRMSQKIFDAKNFSERTTLFDRPERMDTLVATLRRWGWSDALLEICRPVLDFRATILQAYYQLQSQLFDDGPCWKLDKFLDEPYLDFKQSCLIANYEANQLEETGSSIHLAYVMRVLNKHHEEPARWGSGLDGFGFPHHPMQ